MERTPDQKWELKRFMEFFFNPRIRPAFWLVNKDAFGLQRLKNATSTLADQTAKHIDAVDLSDQH